MPVETQHPLHALTTEAFGALSFDVMRDVFAICSELGRFFDERIYKQALATVRTDLLLEVWVDVTHDTFRKRYLLDVVGRNGGVFEFKTVERLTPRHDGQLLNYLLLANVSNGLLLNVRSPKVEHRYVNNAVLNLDRRQFTVHEADWVTQVSSADMFRELLIAVLSDWGTGLELSLYEEALTHFLGGQERVEQRIEVLWKSRSVGTQLFRLAAPGVAFKLTAFKSLESQERYHEELKQLTEHVSLDAILWANITLHDVVFRIVQRK